MGRLFYSLAGEGRGHATRARTIIEALRHEHEVHVYAPGDAHDFLSPLYAGSEVRVERIAGLRFAYAEGGELHYGRTVLGAFAYLRNLGELVGQLEQDLRALAPTLAVVDFEPALARAAARVGVPLVSLDHQHVLSQFDLSSLPWKLRMWARSMTPLIEAFCPSPAAIITSSFYRPGLRTVRPDVHSVGVLLRPEIRNARPSIGKHCTAYLRRGAPPALLRALHETGERFRVYGLGSRAPLGRVEFCPIREQAFVRDLASCKALVTTAGNQLVGEALHLGKPVLAIPEPGNREQAINAHFLDQSGAGQALELADVDARAVRSFLARAGDYAARAEAGSWDGTAAALEILNRYLAPSPAVVPVTALSRTA